ncbi:MAG: PEGA domain-containing protein [Deltaproteobacteria bacterium]|nr:PEGA domain-containing protein [Deltaproteobacteria bacterium]
MKAVRGWAVSVAVAVGACAVMAGCAISSTYSEERGVSNDGYIHVLGSPPEARIFVDGQEKGFVGMPRIRVASGVHTVEVRCEGYLTMRRQVFVNQSTETIRVDLTPAR